jgi:hypothetical protein
LALIASVAVLSPGQATSADDTMRCGSRIISTGDGKDKVRALCGAPTDISFSGTVGRGAYPSYGPYDYSYIGPAWVELPVEIWTYNFGSSKLLRKLRFVGDELVDIHTEGYGY